MYAYVVWVTNKKGFSEEFITGAFPPVGNNDTLFADVPGLNLIHESNSILVGEKKRKYFGVPTCREYVRSTCSSILYCISFMKIGEILPGMNVGAGVVGCERAGSSVNTCRLIAEYSNWHNTHKILSVLAPYLFVPDLDNF